MARHEFQVGTAFHRRRLDEFLFNEFTSLSKAYLRSVMKEGGCEVNGVAANAGQILRERDFVEIEINESMETGMTPEALPLEVLYEDHLILAIEKPPGVLVHPTNYERNGTILNAMTYYLNRDRSGGQEFVRPHLIHRLDKDTSGVLIAAKDQRSSRILCSHFKRGHFKKSYIAAVEGIVECETGKIELPIGRNSELKKWEVREDGKESLTRYSVIERGKGYTMLELEPVTGRTNQLRIHCSAIGHPVIGDGMHGGRPFRRLCLHASRTEFWHPEGGKRIAVESSAEFASDPDLAA